MDVPSGASRGTYVADASYRMPDRDKMNVMDIFDVAALERLIAMLPPEHRTEVLSHFQYADPPSEAPPPKLVRFDDPDLQAALERVWVPYWYTLPPEAVCSDSQIPGRQLALRAAERGRVVDIGGAGKARVAEP
ncbi:MAG TPA: hypothetical protein VF705_00900 [Longimicrobium sp.]|jgi:hypothetical protein